MITNCYSLLASHSLGYILSFNFHAKDERNSSNLCMNISNGWSTTEMMCTEGFYLENTSSHSPVCIPYCESWLTIVADDMVLAFSLIICMISSAVLFALLWPQRDSM